MGDMACARQTTARMPGRADPFAPVLLALAVIVLAAALGRRAAGLLGAPATLMLAVMLWPSHFVDWPARSISDAGRQRHADRRVRERRDRWHLRAQRPLTFVTSLRYGLLVTTC